MKKATRINNLLRKYPDISVAEIAKRTKSTPGFVYQVRKKFYDSREKYHEASAPADAPVTKPVAGIDATLNERASTYGLFRGQAEISQTLKSVIIDFAAERNANLDNPQREALEMICHKIARIINGDPNHHDSWHDIAGYAQLVADQIRGIER